MTAADVLEGPNGFRLRLLTTATESDGELLAMEATYGETNWMPPAHLHPGQDERFTVLDGALRVVIDGAEATHAAGATFEVPAGTPHQMVAEGASRLRWEVRPALRTAEFLTRLYAGPPAGEDGAAWGAALLAEYADEIVLV